MHFYPALIFVFCFAPAILADDRSSKQGQPQLFKKSNELPRPVAGATFTAPHSELALTSAGTQFLVPEVTKDLQTKSSAILGVTLDGLDGCVGLFAGVQIIVDQGEVYYYAVSRGVADVDYEVYSGSAAQPGEWITILISPHEGLVEVDVSYADGSVSVTINLGGPLCTSYASWVVEELPNLPLTKFGTVDLVIMAGNGPIAFNTDSAKAFSNASVTASVFAHGRGVSITAK